MYLLHLSANATLQCISNAQVNQEPPEEIESDLCDVFAPLAANFDVTILPNMAAMVLGLACVLGTLLFFH